jgi:aryl sulfotransferase
MREYRTWSLDSRRWNGFQPRPDDIVIATQPKCGTTWMQQIVGSLVFRDPSPRALPQASPWIDQRFRSSVEETYAMLDAQTHRRFIKTHLPIDGLPLFDEVRYIHVARDGRDVALSAHNHFGGNSAAQLATFDRIGLEDPAIGRPYPRLPHDPAEYFRLWISTPALRGQSDGLPSTSFFDFVAGYWAERRRENFLLVHYADLSTHLEDEMRRIAAFLDIEIEEALWPSLVEAARFENMKAVGDVLMPHVNAMLDGGTSRFFNKGGLGRWREILTEADLALYEAKVREKFSPDLAAWVEGGRAPGLVPRDRIAVEDQERAGGDQGEAGPLNGRDLLAEVDEREHHEH